VTIFLVNTNEFAENITKAMYFEQNQVIQTLSPHEHAPIKGILVPKLETDGIATYQIHISAQNGTVIQVLKIRARWRLSARPVAQLPEYCLFSPRALPMTGSDQEANTHFHGLISIGLRNE
jgi:hypothetical protein